MTSVLDNRPPDAPATPLPAAENLAELAGHDARGLLFAPGETLAEYLARLARLETALGELEADLANAGRSRLCPELPLRREDRIPAEIMAEAGAATDRHYAFRIDWVPGFFLSRSLGLLWGGCAISFPEDGGLSLFLIRSAFARHHRWLIYQREELLAHELCHAARMPLADRIHEEWFAYRLSPSRLRRYLGNCFQSAADALVFLVPVLLLLVAQIVQLANFIPGLPIWPFWLAAGAGPAWLLLRNHLAHRRLHRAIRALAGVGVRRPEAVLFRCSGAEIATLAGFVRRPAAVIAWLEERVAAEPRWRVIRYRFLAALNPGPAEA